MQVSYFETGRYYAPSNLPRQWPMPAGAYDREAGLRAVHGMVERSRYVEELGFDWVSVSEHHYSPRILTRVFDRRKRRAVDPALFPAGAQGSPRSAGGCDASDSQRALPDSWAAAPS